MTMKTSRSQFSLRLETVLATILVIGCLFFAYLLSAEAWTPPGANPPNDNVPAPLNVSNGPQTKPGPLGALQFRSNAYCDSAGANCFSPAAVKDGGMSLEIKGVPWNDLERPMGPGDERGMIHIGSVTQRCRELGYDFGYPLRLFVEDQVVNNQQWCHYDNANTDIYAGDINSPGGAKWIRASCKSNENVHTAICVRVVK